MLPLTPEDMACVASLRSLNLYDNPPQESFDRVVRLAQNLFDCPMGALSVLDEDRQWFLSLKGREVAEVSREASFCRHVVAAGDCLAIEDTFADERFAANPAVISGPKIRSYLGSPVRAPDGNLIGALCVADERPRRFSKADREQIVSLAEIMDDLIRSDQESSTRENLNKALFEEAQALKKSNQLLKQAEKAGAMAAWGVDLKTREMSFSDEMYAFADLTRGQTIDVDGAFENYRKEDWARISDAITGAARDGIPFQYEADFITAKGSVKRVRCVGERFEGGEDSAPRVVGMVQDITESYHADLALQRAADYDSLTSIYNRHAFDKSLHDKILQHRSTKESLSLLLLDLDGFKDINDSFGHVVGDVVLEEVSARIAKATEAGTVLARWGGDEFALLPPLGSSSVEVSNMAEQVLSAIGTQTELSGRRLQLSGTCGIAQFEEGISARELVRRADLALYHGKKRERSTIHWYSESLEVCNQARQAAITEVRQALDEERVFAAYQPIVRLHDNEVLGMEALMRLNSRCGRKVTAGEVLPALLDPIISRAITCRMIRFLPGDLRRLQAAQSELQFVSMNVTEADLLSRGFAERFIESISGAGVDLNRVTIEITETMLLVNDNKTVRNVLCQLHSAGVRIALDDFGTGYSSLSHLRDFPIDKVKIDKSFVQAAVTDFQARAIVQALIAMAANMNIVVIAEGVETEDQRNLLQDLGCDLAQGFLFSPAMEVDSAALCTLNGQSSRRSISAA